MDYGLYTGLQRKSNIFETKAQNRQMELQIHEVMAQKSQKDMEKSSEVDAKMQEYFSAINDMDILEQDRERVQSAEKRSRADVINLVKKYNGNLKHFMYGGGQGALAKYQNDVMQSEEVKTALSNKMQYAQWKHAEANGLFVKEVGIDVPVLDAETGEVTKDRRKVSMDQAYEMFEKGHITELPYDGAEQDIDVGPDYFQKFYKDPSDPYSDDNKVNPNDIFLWVKERGGSDDQAAHKMKKYIEYVNKGGTEWAYKTADKLDKALKLQRLSNMRLDQKMKRTQMESMSKTAKLDYTRRVKTAQPGDDITLHNDEWDLFSKYFNMAKQEDGTYKTGRNVTVFDRWSAENKNPKSYDLSKFKSIWPEGIHINPKDGKPYLKLGVKTDGSLEEGEMPFTENIFGWNNPEDGVDVDNWKFDSEATWETGTYTGNVYLDINTWYDDDFDRAELNYKTAPSANMDQHPFRQSNSARVYDEGYNYYNSAMQAASQYFPNASDEEIQEQVYGYIQGQQPSTGRPTEFGTQRTREEQRDY